MSDILNYHAGQPHQPWGKGTLFSVGAHLALALLAVITFEKQSVQPISPAAVMLEFAPEAQSAVTPPDVPVGIDQQRKVDASKAEVTPEKVETHRAVEAEDGELALKKPNKPTPEPLKKRDVQKKNHLHQQAVNGNSTVTSRAAPLPQQKQAATTAAPVDSNADSVRQARLSWEGLVMGQLNRVKQFPADAKRRGREGVATVTFSVNAAGAILTSRLANSSGTIALDREALAMLERAGTLPAPPAGLVVNGRYTVTLPVSFDLKK